MLFKFIKKEVLPPLLIFIAFCWIWFAGFLVINYLKDNNDEKQHQTAIR